MKNSNPSAGEFQDLRTDLQTDLQTGVRALWEAVAARVRGWGDDFIGKSGLSSVGAVFGATYPKDARRGRELMPNSFILVPGYGTQGASAADAAAAARRDGSGIIVNSSRGLMYAYMKDEGKRPGDAAASAAEAMRIALNAALAAK